MYNAGYTLKSPCQGYYEAQPQQSGLIYNGAPYCQPQTIYPSYGEAPGSNFEGFVGWQPYHQGVSGNGARHQGSVAVRQAPSDGQDGCAAYLYQPAAARPWRYEEHYTSARGVQQVHHDMADSGPADQNASRGSLRCADCKMQFRKKREFARHVRTHTGEKPFQCTVCQEKFAITSSLLRHIRETHNGSRNHLCDVCGKLFSRKANLMRHLKVHQ